MEKNNTCFISIAGSPPAWYRCALPAITMGQKWLGIVGGIPGEAAELAGNVEDPNFDDFSHLIVQQANTEEWLEFIKERRSNGQKVIYEIDDFVHGVARIKEHTHRKAKQFTKKYVKLHNECMSECDAVICSTEFLANEYKKYNENIFVCKVGIDTERYIVEPPERDFVTIGWSGGTGHHLAVGPWLQEITKILDTYKNVIFASIGTAYADAIKNKYPDQTLTAPWTTIENIPFALTSFDIAIAPAHESKYHLAKSDLRWLEASAVGIPTVCDPRIYDEVNPSLAANSPKEAADIIMELIEDKEERISLGKHQQEYVQKNRDISIASTQWLDVINKI